MDDSSQALSGQLGAILNDPQSMERIRSLAASLGLGDSPPAPAPAPPAPTPAPASAVPLQGMDPNLLQTVSRLMPLFSRLRQEDDSTRLLHALRPLLSPARQKKIDEAVRILQLMRLMPQLKQSGILTSLLGS